MIEITFLGHSGIKIRGKKVSLVLDPPNSEILGIAAAKQVTADIVLLSQKELPTHSNLAIVKPVNQEIFQITGPGEYEILQTEIEGFAAQSNGVCLVNLKESSNSNKLTVYHITIDGASLAFLGTISKLPQNLIEHLSTVDVLFLPVGGKVSIEPKEAVNVITNLEPKIVVPIHYAERETEVLGTLDKFLAAIGKIPTETLDKLLVSKEKLPEEVKIVVLAPVKN